METGRASMTALITAFRRAYHYSHDTPRIFEDSLAGVLLSAQDRRAVEDVFVDSLVKFYPDLAPPSVDREVALAHAMRLSPGEPLVLGRARYTEDKLAEGLRNGISQYVIIGAGLDTFALRRRDLSERLQIFELDHPATQNFKRQRLREAGLAAPPNLHFGAADLERESVAAALSQLPYDPRAPTFFAWLGVTMYLTRNAIVETLRSIRSAAAPGSELAFDYIDAAGFLPGNASPGVGMVLDVTRSLGEPLIFGFDPALLRAELSAVGFDLLEDMAPQEQGERFFNDRADGLRAWDFGRFAHARVC